MKKTIMLLCAAASAVALAETTPATLTSTFTGSQGAQAKNLVTESVFGEVTTTTTTAITNANTLKVDGAVAYAGSFYIPSVNLDSGTWTQTFSYTLPSYVTGFSLSSIDIHGLAVGGNGASHGTSTTWPVAVDYQVSITTASGTTVLGTSSYSGTPSQLTKNPDVFSNGAGYQFSGSTITLSQPLEVTGGFTLSISAAKPADVATGGLYGLEKITLKGTADVVPEPATATLSLLALAGLAARRRRK